MLNIDYTDYDRKVWQEELKNFVPDEFVDAHVHLWLEDMPGCDFKSNGGATWTQMVAPDLSAEDLNRIFQIFYSGKRCLPLIFGGCRHDHGVLNAYVQEKGEEFGYPTLFRTKYDMTGEFIEQEVKKGGFLGLKPYLGHVAPHIPAKEIRIFDFLPHEHLKVADRLGLIVMLHIPRSLRLRDPMNIAQLMEIEEKYPNLKLIVAHIGRAYSMQDLGDAFETLKHTKNMVFDFTANLCDDAIEACINAVGPKRLLFGTDFPIALMRMYRITDENGKYYNVVPRGYYGDVSYDSSMKETDEKDVTVMVYEQLRAFKRVAEKLNLSKADIEDIMKNNALRLIQSVQY